MIYSDESTSDWIVENGNRIPRHRLYESEEDALKEYVIKKCMQIAYGRLISDIDFFEGSYGYKNDKSITF